MQYKKNRIYTIQNAGELDVLQRISKSFIAVLFYKSASLRSQQARERFAKVTSEMSDIFIGEVNVGVTKDVHPRFNVTHVPTVIVLREARMTKKLEGLQSEQLYRMLFFDAPRTRADGSTAPPLRVTVYSSPTCPPCATVKSYLRKKGVPFRVIDITRDEQAAQEITARSGSMSVPQIEINGTIVVGADTARIDELLSR